MTQDQLDRLVAQKYSDSLPGNDKPRLFGFSNTVDAVRYGMLCERERSSILVQAMEDFCQDNGYDHPSLIHENAGHPIPRALAVYRRTGATE